MFLYIWPVVHMNWRCSKYVRECSWDIYLWVIVLNQTPPFHSVFLNNTTVLSITMNIKSFQPQDWSQWCRIFVICHVFIRWLVGWWND